MFVFRDEESGELMYAIERLTNGDDNSATDALWLAEASSDALWSDQAISDEPTGDKHDYETRYMLAEHQGKWAACQNELYKCDAIALKLDKENPTLPGAFTGTQSERIARQLQARGVAPFDVKNPW